MRMVTIRDENIGSDEQIRAEILKFVEEHKSVKGILIAQEGKDLTTLTTWDFTPVGLKLFLVASLNTLQHFINMYNPMFLMAEVKGAIEEVFGKEASVGFNFPDSKEDFLKAMLAKQKEASKGMKEKPKEGKRDYVG